jgi:hypothetical protein
MPPRRNLTARFSRMKNALILSAVKTGRVVPGSKVLSASQRLAWLVRTMRSNHSHEKGSPRLSRVEEQAIRAVFVHDPLFIIEKSGSLVGSVVRALNTFHVEMLGIEACKRPAAFVQHLGSNVDAFFSGFSPYTLSVFVDTICAYGGALDFIDKLSDHSISPDIQNHLDSYFTNGIVNYAYLYPKYAGEMSKDPLDD